MRRAVFFDRDGTLIHDEHYLAKASRVRPIPGAIEALRRSRADGRLLVIVSNQSGLARGLIRPEEHAAVHARTMALFADAGVPIDAAYYCEHGPDAGCACRKPRPGMLLRAATEHGIDLAGSIMIGDKRSDVEAGEAAGARGVLFRGDWEIFFTCLHFTRIC